MRKCDNWRGIALLDAVGKLTVRIIQERLQTLAEEELPESRCGFRKGRGCSDNSLHNKICTPGRKVLQLGA